MSLRAFLFRKPPRAPEPQTIDIAFDQAVYRVQLKRHRQSRRYTLRVQASTRDVVLTMPLRGSVRDARRFAEKHGAWIATRLNRLPQSAPFRDGEIVPLRGEPHRIVHRKGVRGTVAAETDANGERLLCVFGQEPHVARRMRDFLKRQARSDLEAASRNYADTLGVSIKRVSVRDQASRWGSCSATGALSYSWRLIIAPPYVLDYLAAHEVAHLVEMNHSARFWKVVNRICPNVDRAKAWLEAHGADLHRYGSPD